MKIDPSGASAHELRRPEQPRAVAVLRGGAPAHRRAHLPGRRPRLHAQRRRGLRGAAAEPVRALRGQLLRRPRGRARPRAGAADHPPVREAGSARVRRRRRADRPARSRRRRRSAIASWTRPSYMPVEQLGTTDDCGFSPFFDDRSTDRDTAFAKIRARVRGHGAGRGRSRRRRMMPADDEDELLRSVAMQNASSILVARQRAEQALLRRQPGARAATDELAQSLAMMRATLESTWDGILVTDADGRVTDFNQRFVRMWGLPDEVVARLDHRAILAHIAARFADGDAFAEPDRGDLRRHARREPRPPGARRRPRVRAVLARADHRRPRTSGACGASATSRSGARWSRRCATSPACWSC